MLYFTMCLTQNVLSKHVCFYKYAHNSVPRGSADLILIAFDGKFHGKKDEIPPRACRPSKKFQKMYLEMGPPPARPPERGVRGASSWKKKKRGLESLVLSLKM